MLALGFHCSVVLADSLYGESGTFISALHRLGLQYVVAIRSNHGVWLGPGQRVRHTQWRPFDRVFTDGSSEQRFIRETIYGTRGAVRYYQITTDPETVPRETTWDVMTNQPGKIERTVGNTFGLRTWVEYGFKHAKDDLGWADYRVTDYASIERWWELVMSAYTLVSLQTLADEAQGLTSGSVAPPLSTIPSPLREHPARDAGIGWKQHLNNLRLLLQPYVCSCLLMAWLPLIPHPYAQALQSGFAALATLVNAFRLALPT